MRIPSEEKYYNDANFRTLVDCMLAAVSKLDTSFSEIREACLFAQIKYELQKPYPDVFISPELLSEIEFRRRK